MFVSVYLKVIGLGNIDIVRFEVNYFNFNNINYSNCFIYVCLEEFFGFIFLFCIGYRVFGYY